MKDLTTDERLAQVPLFAGLSKKELVAVSSLATRLDLTAGKELTKQGETGNEFVIILDGEVNVVIDGNVVATRGPGDYFGEIALLSERPRTATVVAKTAVAIEVIGRREFRGLVDDQPAIEAQLRAVMAERLDADDID
ncbi:MAG TPA: cyclic nucleotide-binding domain-containing protein [Acidimicrobiia bacterium]|nr:cyclic nucleotide-binding domain-containing protein [Acidimicrobiia bacterium]